MSGNSFVSLSIFLYYYLFANKDGISYMDIPYIPLMSIAGEVRGYHRWRRRHLEESLA